MVLSAASGILIFLLVFSGNSTIFGFEIFFLIYPFAMGQLLFFNTTQHSKSLVAIFAVLSSLMILAIPVAYFSGFANLYYLWPIKSFLLLAYTFFVKDVTFDRIFVLFLVGFLVILLSSSTYDETGRLYTLFGPNMLYRVLAFSVGFFLYRLHESSFRQKLLSVIISFFSLFGIVLTGSIGGLLSLAAVTYQFMARKIKWLFLFLILIASYLLFLWSTLFAYMTLNSVLLSRLLYKIFDGEDVRGAGFYYLLKNSDFPGFSHHADFSGFWTETYHYPHNIFVELIVFYGFIGVFIGLSILIYTMWAIRFLNWRSPVLILFLITFIGANLSADLSDNFGIFGLMILGVRSQMRYHSGLQVSRIR